VKSVTLDGKIEWFGEGKYSYLASLWNGFYLDDDGTFVVAWHEDYSAFPEKALRQYLLRISPDGSYTKTLIYDSGSFSFNERIIIFDSIGVFKNSRGNTVLFSTVVDSDRGVSEEEMDVTYTFEEFDYDFNRVNKIEYSEDWNMFMTPAFMAMDDNGYFYTGSYGNATVYNPDFEYLGEITGLPMESHIGLFMPITGSDGAVYIYDEELCDFYEIDPQTLKAKKVFTLSEDESRNVWRGDIRDGALFYTAGELPDDEFERDCLIKIDKNGSASRLMYWEEAGNDLNHSAENNDVDFSDMKYSYITHNGNFYYIKTEDSDGNDETEGDEVIKLISFIRNWE
jgi:hypothetical protein